MTGDDVRAAAAAARELLARVPDGAAAVPQVGADVAGVAHHVTSCLTWYAQDLVAGTAELGTFDVVRRPDVELDQISRQLGAAA